MHSYLLNSPLLATALEPVLAALELCPSRRSCPALDDPLWLRLMLLRLWEECPISI